MKLVLTCEHGGYKIPDPYRVYFQDAESVLHSHRGYDPGSLDLYKKLLPLADFGRFQDISRLLVEMNRSFGHPQLFSEFTVDLDSDEKDRILKQYYFPYREPVNEYIGNLISEGEEVLHLSIHSFTPTWNGKKRKADIGLLFDPGRMVEKNLCRQFKKRLQSFYHDLCIRFNYPYLGTSDGFTTSLRSKFPENYAGIELEVNQVQVRNNIMDHRIKDAVLGVLLETITTGFD